jgi:hypothetical protein
MKTFLITTLAFLCIQSLFTDSIIKEMQLKIKSKKINIDSLMNIAYSLGYKKGLNTSMKFYNTHGINFPNTEKIIYKQFKKDSISFAKCE